MKRSGTAPEDYITPILRRLWSTADGHRQEDLAAQLGCERSRIAHQLAGRQCIPAHELLVWCIFFDTNEPLDASARRLGEKLVPMDAPSESPRTLRRAVGHLSRDMGELMICVDDAEADGKYDADEIAQLDAALLSVERGAAACRSRLPRGKDGV